ncbi:solute carrier family 12 member 3-like [Archocentrus centrarchus]|uniref:solute carrier family 12 member 3-like n=1 Tax=Archocentrus centrarchus TaxID=63155 RepID=UPI0011EA0D70|nr:solute carrier family 12 member 3-like [Archocentrus centrarchus]
MGQFITKRKESAPGIDRQVHFSTNEEGPPRYSSHHFDGSREQDGIRQVHPNFISGEGFSPSEWSDPKMDLRRSSYYSTIDLVPKLEHYADSIPRPQAKSRPSLEALRKAFEEMESGNTTREQDVTDNPATESENEQPKDPNAKPPVRFGWIIGVKMRCMLNIWGVILYLRLTWITSEAGIVLTLVIIFLAVSVTTTTALSICAIATNGRVKSGGAYFMISRSLGPELGASIGLIFSFANALNVGLHTVGFSEVVSTLMQSMGTSLDSPANNIRVVGVCTVTVLLCIALAGMDWESKTQIVFFIVLLASLVNYIVGTLIPPSKEKQALGIFGYRSDIFVENLTPDWRGPDGNFARLFAIFFPACTGIMSGVSICGDLKDPNSAIPKGTLWAIFWTTLSYVVLTLTSGACVVRDASGNINDTIIGNSTDGCIGLACNLGWNFTKCIESHTCKQGLANSLQVMGQLSGSYHVMLAGVFAATLSSALGFIVSAPKIFQRLCTDKIYPYIGFFGKGYGKNNEPYRAYILCYVIAVCIILIAQLNAIAPLISNFFLCSYGLINFSCFHATVTNAPGWRPSFHYYSKWTALYGTVSAGFLMFFFTWWAALVTFVIIFFLFGYIIYKKPKSNWGSSVQASSYNMALSASLSLTGVEDHVKNFRPQCLVLTGPPNQRPALVDFVAAFTKNASLMICGDIIMEPDRQTQLQDIRDQMVKWLNKRKVRSFYTQFTADILRDGTHFLLQASGLGKLKPNTLVLGFKTNWRESSPESIEDYIHTIYDTFDSNFSVCILRMMDGLDMSDQFEVAVNQGFEPDESVESDDHQSPEKESAADVSDNSEIKTVFQNSQGKKNIDIYWIADDGGLTLLVPYLLARRKRWRSCKIRVFIIGDEQNMEERREDMSTLLKRFRLAFDVIVMTNTETSPQPKNMSRFVDSIAPFRLYHEELEGISVQELRQREPWKISDKEFEAFKVKSERKVRLNEIIRKNSHQTALVLVSLPVPRGDCPSALYMAWLDTLTSGLYCPVVLIRGNQQNAITFYCQ